MENSNFSAADSQRKSWEYSEAVKVMTILLTWDSSKIRVSYPGKRSCTGLVKPEIPIDNNIEEGKVIL